MAQIPHFFAVGLGQVCSAFHLRSLERVDAREAIELLTQCFVLVQGQTVSIMGSVKGIKQADPDGESRRSGL